MNGCTNGPIVNQTSIFNVTNANVVSATLDAPDWRESARRLYGSLMNAYADDARLGAA